MDPLTPLQTCALVALLDAGIAVAAVYRRRQSERWVLRLERGSAGSPTRPATTGKRRQAARRRRVVAVLESLPAMQRRVRDAVGDLTYDLRFTSTWTELQEVVASVLPAAIVADPLADLGGDPETHLVELSQVRHIPILLHTQLTPACANVLLRLGRRDFRRVVIHPFGDDPKSLATALEAVAFEAGGPSWPAA
jgi:hypothetical protein